MNQHAHMQRMPARLGSVLRRRPLRSAAGLIGAVTIAGGIAAAVQPAAQAAGTSHHTVIRLTSISKDMTRVPIGGVEVDVDKSGGKVIGADTLICRVVSKKKPPKCAATVDLSGGVLLFTATPTKTGAVGRLTGASGKYAGSTGSIRATSESPTRTKVVIRLSK